jgi:hypothetical protein
MISVGVKKMPNLWNNIFGNFESGTMTRIPTASLKNRFQQSAPSLFQGNLNLLIKLQGGRNEKETVRTSETKSVSEPRILYCGLLNCPMTSPFFNTGKLESGSDAMAMNSRYLSAGNLRCWAARHTEAITTPSALR